MNVPAEGPRSSDRTADGPFNLIKTSYFGQLPPQQEPTAWDGLVAAVAKLATPNRHWREAARAMAMVAAEPSSATPDPEDQVANGKNETNRFDSDEAQQS